MVLLTTVACSGAYKKRRVFGERKSETRSSKTRGLLHLVFLHGTTQLHASNKDQWQCIDGIISVGERVIAQALIGKLSPSSPRDACTIADPTATFTINFITTTAAIISAPDLTIVAADGRRGDGFIARIRRYGYYTQQQTRKRAEERIALHY